MSVGGRIGSAGAGAGNELALAHAEGSVSRQRRQADPLAAVIALGDKAARVGAVLGVALALLMHGAASARAVLSLHEMWLAMDAMRTGLHDYFWTMYDVDLTPPKAPEEKPPEPEPEPEPEPAPVVAPAPKAPPPPETDPYEPPPAPAQAAKVLTAPEDPGEEKIEDLTDQGFVSGDGTGPGYGQVSAAGTGTVPTFSPHAKVGGVPGGKGTGAPQAPPPPPPGPDLSRSPTIAGSTSWNCPFPPEADAEQIDQAVVVLVVTVRPDGTALSAKVVSNPGYGFGEAARICALGRRYTPGLDKMGTPITATMPPVKVRFSR
jgi:protein TonB